MTTRRRQRRTSAAPNRRLDRRAGAGSESSWPPEPHRVRVRRPVDFLAVIPYLLGFHPEESLVVVLSTRGRVVLTGRLDLPAAEHVGDVAEQVRELAAGQDADGHPVGVRGVDELILVAYSADEDHGRQVLEQVRRGLPDVVVREVLLVSGARFWSLSCTTGCCPPEGSVLDLTAHPLAAEAVYRGLPASRSRADLEALVAGPAESDLPRLRALVERERAVLSPLTRPVAAAAMMAAVTDALDLADGLDEPAAARLAVLTADLAVRDVAWAMIERATAAEHQALWCRVVGSVPPEVSSGPVGLLGVAAWVSGHGALLNCCVERLERTDPGYTLGRLLSDLSTRAIPPSLWDEMAVDLRAEVAAVTGAEGLH